MKKLFVIITACTCLLSGCAGSNPDLAATTYFPTAMIKLADDTVITVSIKSYNCGTNSVIIETTDGHYYGVAYTDVTFMK